MKRSVSLSLRLIIALLTAVLPALWPTTSQAADTLAERRGSTEPASPPAIRLLAVTVYEDVDGDTVGAGDPGVAGVSLRLYQDNDDNGVVDNGDTFVAATTTNFTGDYNFSVDTDGTGNQYLIAADSRSVRPAAGLNGGFAQDDLWAQQTYGDDPATRVLDVGARYGGLTSGVSDDYNPTSTNPQQNRYQHLARVDVGGGDGVGIDFGFGFNVVTNARAGDDADDAGG